MAKLAIKKASTDVTVYLFIQDSSKTTGEGLTGLAYNTASLVASYVRPAAARAALSLATQTVDGSHSDGGFKEVDATNMPGVYRLDLPDAVCATGVNSAVVMLKGAANMSPVVLELQLTDFDLNTAAITAAGIADAVWDEATADHTTASSFGSLDANVDSILADTGTDGVLLSAGTGAKQISLSSGAVLLQATQTGVTIPTVTTLTNLPSIPNNWITAAGIATGAIDADAIADGAIDAGAIADNAIDAGAIATGAITNAKFAAGAIDAAAIATDAIDAASVKADAVTKIQTGLATPTNITAGTITTVTNLTNAPTTGDFTATMKSSITSAASSATPALSAAGVDAILDEVVVGTYTMRQLLTVMGSALAGKLSGGGTTTLTFRGINDASDVIVATVDANGNRSDVTVTV